LTKGQALIIIAGGIDLSVGSILGLMGVVTALFARAGLHPVLVFFCVIFVGICVSSINGLLITQIGINPFIATLGMLSIARGTSLLITGGMPLSIDSNNIVFLGSGRWGPVPIPVIIMLIIAVLGFVFSTMMLPGRNVYAIGNNERSARLSGIRVERVRIMTFSIMGALCAISGMITSGTLKTAEPNAGMGFELDAIAAVVIGGASLSGGEGSIPGAIIGAAILGVLRNSFVLLGVSAYWQVVAIGIVTIAAVSIDSLKSKKTKQ
jgi:ribose transport system permease protein